MKTKILTILKERNSYVSGQELCEQFKVSRTAIWKVIKQLKEKGYKIESVSNRGYYLMEYPDIVTEEEIGSSIKTQWIGKKVKFYNELDSTNLEAKRLADNDNDETNGMLIVAEKQNAGRGRRGKQWITPSGTGIWMSLILKPDIEPDCASMLTLIVALATAKSIFSFTGLNTFIKWPNDVIINGKKVCGILTEMNSERDYIHYIVIGIGINTNIKEFPDEIKAVATSLFIEGNQTFQRSSLIAELLKEFEYYYEKFLQKRNLTDIIVEYNEKLISKNKEVKIIEQKEEWIGTSLGIDEKGRLLVKLSNGEEKKIVSGEVSVRGLCSYI